MNDSSQTAASPKIRYFEHTDAPNVSPIYRAAAKEAVTRERSYYQVPNEEVALEHFRNFEPSEEEAIFVCEVGGEVIGFVQVLVTRPGEKVPMIKPRTAGFVKELAVAEPHRRKGIGKKLAEVAQTWCLEHGAEIILLDTGWKNLEAVEFYETMLGYRKLGVILIKELSAGA